MSMSNSRKAQGAKLNRRQMLKIMGTGSVVMGLAACGQAATPAPAPTAVPATAAPEATAAPPTAAPEPTAVPPTEAPKAMVNSVGKELPADAAPPEQQVYLLSGGGNPGTDGQITASVYNRSGLADL